MDGRIFRRNGWREVESTEVNKCRKSGDVVSGDGGAVDKEGRRMVAHLL